MMTMQMERLPRLLSPNPEGAGESSPTSTNIEVEQNPASSIEAALVFDPLCNSIKRP